MCIRDSKYTEHGYAHAGITSSVAQSILSSLGYDERTCQLAAIAGYMHDIGNSINRHDHAMSGGIMAFSLLNKIGMDQRDVYKRQTVPCSDLHRSTPLIPMTLRVLMLLNLSWATIRGTFLSARSAPSSKTTGEPSV